MWLQINNIHLIVKFKKLRRTKASAETTTIKSLKNITFFLNLIQIKIIVSQ
jgi:hypothetical protein